MKAILANYRQAPRKVRLVADLVRGQTVNEALRRLKFLTKRASSPLAKLISSAAAQARQAAVSASGAEVADNLIIGEITVNKGLTFKRYRPRARGRASSLHKRTSHVVVVLEPQKLQATS